MRKRNVAAVKKLVEHGARADMPDGKGKTALVLAREAVKRGEEG
jgi:hypothetical protein